MKNKITLDRFFKKENGTNGFFYSAIDETLPQLPEGWRWKRLKDIGTVVNGFGFPLEYQGKKGLPYGFVKVNDMNLPGNDIYIYQTTNTVDESILTAIGGKLYPPGTIIFPKIGGAVATNKKRILAIEASFDNNIMGIVPSSTVHPKWLYFFLCNLDLMALTKTTTMPSIRKTKVENIWVPVPSLDVQRRVVARVEELTSRIEQAKKLREEALKETEKIMQTALHQTFKNPEQKGWKQYTINEITVDLKSGFACSKKYEVPEGIPHLRPNNIGYYGKLDLSKIVCIPENMVDLKTYSLKRGDVLFNNTNSKELVGRAALVEEDLNYAFSNHITRIRVNTELLTPEWLVTCLNYLWLKGYFLHICQKWIGQAGINTRMLKSVKVYIPSIEEQKAITERLNKIQKIIENFNTQQNKTKAEIESLSQAILKAAFSGKL